VVQDLERMHAFYTQVLELQPVTNLTTADSMAPPGAADELRVPELDRLLGLKRIRLHIRHVDDKTHPMFLELLQYVNHARRPAKSPIQQPGLNHLGLEVTGLDAILARMRDTGLGSAGPVVTMPMFNGRLVIVRDPEGNVLELRESFTR
jgi:catechol 2,3-dioxygenase-like lactoylglutathione lyase family enzyme